MRPLALLLCLLPIAPALVHSQQDDLQKLRAQRKADILAVADNPALTLEQKKAMIRGIRKGYSKRIHDLPASAPSAPAPAADDARAQLRAQRKAEILAVANDPALTLDQKKEKISALRAGWRKSPDAAAHSAAPTPSRKLDDQLLP